MKFEAPEAEDLAQDAPARRRDAHTNLVVIAAAQARQLLEVRPFHPNLVAITRVVKRDHLRDELPPCVDVFEVPARRFRPKGAPVESLMLGPELMQSQCTAMLRLGIKRERPQLVFSAPNRRAQVRIMITPELPKGLSATAVSVLQMTLVRDILTHTAV